MTAPHKPTNRSQSKCTTEDAKSGVERKLVALTRNGPVAFLDVCDKLDLAPGRLRKLIAGLRSRGINLDAVHDQVGFRPPEVNSRVQPIGIEPTTGKRHSIGVLSDTHLGSKYCLRTQLKDFVDYAYRQGVRNILMPGDLLDGCYRHGIWEVSHSGLDEQARDLAETLPERPGLNYRAITGNHDYTFTEANGVSVGPYLTSFFHERGRRDLHFYGDRGATVRIYGANVDMWHPKKGCAYAVSYGLQKRIESYSSGFKPAILLTGHWHRNCYIEERGIHAFACPTFQGGGSAFGKSLGGAPSIGGLILSWDLTKHGTLRDVIVEKRTYFEVEKPQQIGASNE